MAKKMTDQQKRCNQLAKLLGAVHLTPMAGNTAGVVGYVDVGKARFQVRLTDKGTGYSLTLDPTELAKQEFAKAGFPLHQRRKPERKPRIDGPHYMAEPAPAKTPRPHKPRNIADTYGLKVVG